MTELEFRKSSHSSAGIEVSAEIAVVIRDSRAQNGSQVRLSPDAWAAFLAHCRRSERRRQAEYVRAYVEEHFLGGQALTEEELAEARRALAASGQRAAARAAYKPG